jgi:3',5'-cyclic AMP phosphodiesterase CpdA
VTSFTLAHLSDPHLGPLPATGWAALMSKRLSGFLSWTRNRVKIHRPEILAMLAADLKTQAHDHVAVTGDLVNISLPAEFTAAAAWLQTIAPPEKLTVVPGNHDAYVTLPWAQGAGLWGPYMRGVRSPGSADTLPASEADFPFTRRYGPVALIGTSTAVPMPLFVAAGRLGEAQRARLAMQLKDAGNAGLFRIVLIHHPPFGGGAYKRKSLLDAKEFQAVIAEHGAELVLHGHTHVSGLGRLATPNGFAPVIGVPSASAVAAGHKDPARYHLYRIERRASDWSLSVEVRGLNAGNSGFERQGSMALSIPLLSSTDKLSTTGMSATQAAPLGMADGAVA